MDKKKVEWQEIIEERKWINTAEARENKTP